LGVRRGEQIEMMPLAFEEFIAPYADLPVYEHNLLNKAYQFAKQAHAGQKRMSGEDYFVHCVEVARILLDLGMDTVVVAAGLLHDVVEDIPEITVEDLRAEFGNEVAQLVEGVTKIERIPLQAEYPEQRTRPPDQEAEYLRKTLLAINDDVRVILIKLADRLHNMRTLGHLPRDRQIRNARETMDIFAPLASRLGIWQFKWELEDLSFRYLEPERYRAISAMIAERRADRDYYVSQIIEYLKDVLAKHEIDAEVSGRSKNIYSIARKIDEKGLPFDQIYDVRAVRVVVADVYTCYQVLGIIHQEWRPIAGEFDDYIAAPKDNFYQSLHTAVILGDGKTLEVQIRTPEMHNNAEYGVAAHWRYKESTRQRDESFERRIQYLREMIDIGRGVDDAGEFIDLMRSDVFQDRVYVFSPRGDIYDLPAGSTPIDFAYHIHTDIGHRCRGAKVNGKLVSLDYVLQVGDRVEILTAKRGGPSRDWLTSSLGYVKTKRAVAKIRQWFRRQDYDKMVIQGREVLERELKRLGLEKMSHDQVAELFNVDKTEDLLAQIGFGDINTQHIATKILEMERSQAEAAAEPVVARPARPLTTPTQGVRIQGTGGLLTQLARCCNPVQGDEVIGYITRGRGVTVHRRDCPNILNLNEPERLIEVEWGEASDDVYPVPIEIDAYDRKGLVRDISTAVAEEQVNMRNISVQTNNNLARFTVTMEVESAAQLSRVLSKIERVPNVMTARRRKA
jgi:GTP diphosphokinase / guanosine-3',5'-bis(diphosphate) 3'-diphosphatase